MNKIKIALSIALISNHFFSVSYAPQQLVDHVKNSIEKAEKNISKINHGILNLSGYSSAKVRHLLNNICSLPNAHYLEVGVFKGSTFISALFENATLASATAIDDWSEFGGPKGEFQNNLHNYLPANSYKFYDHNCFTLDKSSVFKNAIDIYFYDGNHTFDSHKRAFTYFDEVLANVFIAIVDDWNWNDVSNGTKTAFKELGYTVLFEQALPAYYIGDVHNWWNGFYIAVIQK